MKLRTNPQIEIPSGLLDLIHSFPMAREVEHCGRKFIASPFDIYTECPQCLTRIKLRAFSGTCEVEDVFDAVFEWLMKPEAAKLARRRQDDMKPAGG